MHFYRAYVYIKHSMELVTQHTFKSSFSFRLLTYGSVFDKTVIENRQPTNNYCLFQVLKPSMNIESNHLQLIYPCTFDREPACL